MTEHGEKRTLTIKKYTNRRFYDTTRSRHVTLGEMHDLISEGHDLEISDSKTGDNLTNAVLTQIILEREAPKLDIFPSAVLHQIIRTQQQYLGTVLEQFFAQVVQTHRSSQDQWTRFLKNTLGFGPAASGTPMEWTQSLWNAFSPPPAAHSAPDDSPTVGPSGDDVKPDISDLREQLAEMQRRVDEMGSQRNHP